MRARSPLRWILAALGAAATVAVPAPGAARQGDDTSTPAVSAELGAVPVEGEAATAAQAAYDDTAERLAAVTAARDGAEAELAELAAQEAELTTTIASQTAVRKAAAVALVDARTQVQAAAVSSYVAQTSADELTRVIDVDESVAIGRVQVYADTVRADHEQVADDAQHTLDLASRALDDANVDRRDGRARTLEVTEARDRAASETEVLTSELAERAMARERARATSRVRGVDFSLVALDAYWRAARTQTACGVGWWALAGISRVEGRHGTFRGSRLSADGDVTPPIIGIALDGTRGTRVITDSDGGALDGDVSFDRAVGPMQFIPQTWARWGRDGDGDGDVDPQNLYDATAAAAAYLCRGRDLSGEEGLRAAYFSYNQSQEYVDEVLAHAYGYRQLAIPPVG